MALLIGGVQMGDQVKALSDGVDVLIATPGRLMDLFQRGKILLTGCSMLVIDEADRMLDMGFIPDIEEICSKLPAQRQTLLFSATMPPPIKKLADKFLSNPKYIEVARPASTNINIVQHKVKCVSRQKREVLRHLLRTDNVSTAIIFANRKTTVRELAKSLKRHGFSAGEIHGDMDQSSRIAELDRFKAGAINILVASDVAARGIDVKGVSHVFNFDTPWHPDDYVHRIGRTGRGGATGRAFTLYSSEDAEAIANVEKLTGGAIPEIKVDLGGGADEDKPVREKRESKPSAEKPAAEKKTRERKPRGGKSEAPREEVRAEEPVREAPRRSERQDRYREEPRREAPRREDARRDDRSRGRQDDRRSRWQNDEPPSKPGEWNGPIPEFLGISALD
jgi:superfamily II DNA/RNA helicase